MANVTFPRDIVRDIDNAKVAKPARLYGWTDPNVIGTTYYCFCDFSCSPSTGYSLYVIDLVNPTQLYKKNSFTGEFYATSETISSYDGTTLVWEDMNQIDSGSSARYSQLDETIYEGIPGTLYTDSTTLTTGMPLYNNNGIKYENYKVGEVLTATSFNLLQVQRLNVEDYNYTDDNYNITLTKYIGTNSVVIAPELED